MFPFDEEVELQIDDDKEPVEFGINFETGQLTGNKVYGLEAIKVWCWLALQSKRYTHTQYSFDYGHDLEDLIGKVHSQEYLESEVQRIVKDTLMINENITDVEVSNFVLTEDKLSLNVYVSTKWGETNIDV